jgi:hypothetical protein
MRTFGVCDFSSPIYLVSDYIAGFITLLVSSYEAFTRLLGCPLPTTIGGFTAEISRFDSEPSCAKLHWNDPDELFYTTTCIGLRLRLPGAKTDVITTATHGYVKLVPPLPVSAPRGAGLWTRLGYEARLLKLSLSHSALVRMIASLPAVAWALSRDPNNTPLCRMVYLAGSSSMKVYFGWK